LVNSVPDVRAFRSGKIHHLITVSRLALPHVEKPSGFIQRKSEVFGLLDELNASDGIVWILTVSVFQPGRFVNQSLPLVVKYRLIISIGLFGFIPVVSDIAAYLDSLVVSCKWPSSYELRLTYRFQGSLGLLINHQGTKATKLTSEFTDNSDFLNGPS